MTEIRPIRPPPACLILEFQKKENAYDVPDMELPRLKRNLQNAVEWMSQANSLSAFCGMLLNSPAEAFWSTVVYSKATLQALDSFLESFPR